MWRAQALRQPAAVCRDEEGPRLWPVMVQVYSSRIDNKVNTRVLMEWSLSLYMVQVYSSRNSEWEDRSGPLSEKEIRHWWPCAHVVGSTRRTK